MNLLILLPSISLRVTSSPVLKSETESISKASNSSYFSTTVSITLATSFGSMYKLIKRCSIIFSVVSSCPVFGSLISCAASFPKNLTECNKFESCFDNIPFLYNLVIEVWRLFSFTDWSAHIASTIARKPIPAKIVASS
ncbi:hypothetical protein D3C75_998830 [compost metagenome]